MDILFFSRGRGRGHAIPDAALATDLCQLDPSVTLQFASYGIGAETLRQYGQNVIDLKLPENNPFLDTLVLALRLIGEIRPTLLISHEEFGALPAARVAGIPAVFLTDWFPAAQSLWNESLRYADEILFADDAGYCDEPDFLKGKIIYCGPIIRRLTLTSDDRASARASLGLPLDSTVVLAMPGGSAHSSEQNAPLFDLVLNSVSLLARDTTVIWVASADEHRRLWNRVDRRSAVLFMEPHIDIERTMVASDVAITRATRVTSHELNALGIPSISISYGLNPIDDYRVCQIRTNRALKARGLTASTLSECLREALIAGPHKSGARKNSSQGRADAVQWLLSRLRGVSRRPITERGGSNGYFADMTV